MKFEAFPLALLRATKRRSYLEAIAATDAIVRPSALPTHQAISSFKPGARLMSYSAW